MEESGLSTHTRVLSATSRKSPDSGHIRAPMTNN
jgi:hypothetical protein